MLDVPCEEVERAKVEVVYGFSFVLFDPNKPYVRFGDASWMG